MGIGRLVKQIERTWEGEAEGGWAKRRMNSMGSTE